MKTRGFGLVELLIVVAVVAAIVVTGVAAIVVLLEPGYGDPPTQEDVVQVLQGTGYTDIEYGGTRSSGCGRGESHKQAFKATDQAGRRVSGLVCSGLNMGKTIRLD